MAKIFWGVAKFSALSVVLLIAHLVEYSEAVTNSSDTAALQAFYNALEDPDGHLSNWLGDTDPCDDQWVGVYCCTISATNTSFVQELRLFGFNLGGTLVPELGNLSELGYLDVMWNRLTGNIPSTLGNLGDNLEILLLNGNQLTGTLPPELGNLGELERLQIDENQISGPIPPEFGYLASVLHLHLNNNSLNGSLPKELGNLSQVIHILVDNNNLTGYLPPEIADAPKLLIIQLDNNQFASDATIPPSWGNISTLLKLSLRNCGLTGSIPNFVNTPSLDVLDLSYNMLTDTIPNTTAFPANLTYLDLSYNQLSGQIPTSIGNLQFLQFLALKNNTLSGGIPENLGTGKAFQNSAQFPPQVIDLQNNQLTMSPSVGTNLAELEDTSDTKIYLAGNPKISVCSQAGSTANPLCHDNNNSLNNFFSFDILEQLSSDTCSSCQVITIELRLKSPLTFFFDEYSAEFEDWFSTGLSLTPNQVAVTSYTWMPGPRMNVTILVYPNNEKTTFQQSDFDNIFSNISQWNLNDSSIFGPWELLRFYPQSVAGFASLNHGLSKRTIAGIVLGVTILGMVVTGLVMFGVYWHLRPSAAVRAQIKRLSKVKNNPSLKVAGVIAFTFEELSRATNNFDERNLIGQGGYGKVYVGDVKEVKHRVAIKRAEVGSTQGANEFYTEIELLSRIHHRNLCGLVGYCDDIGEQMLVYEFMPGGTLRDHLSEFAGTPLNFPTRLRVALDSARGILYLHTEANPPIFHRDIKACNILLDGRMVAKVADFGLSRLAPVPDINGATPSHVSTVLKGTPGYMDPEYFLTHKLSDKSDVYSFGVVLLELITGIPVISKGKNIVREAHARYEAGEILSIIDPYIMHNSAKVLKEYMQLAVSCCNKLPNERPTMTEVVHTLEKLSQQYVDLFYDVSSIEMTSSTKPYLPSMYPYSSSEINNAETSRLFSGTVLHVAPR